MSDAYTRSSAVVYSGNAFEGRACKEHGALDVGRDLVIIAESAEVFEALAAAATEVAAKMRAYDE